VGSAADAVQVETAAGPLTAAMVLVACEGASRDVLPALSGVVTPWRTQGMRAIGPQLRQPVICNYGHEIYLPHDLGTLGLEIEVAGLNPNPDEEDCTLDPATTDRFQAFLQSFCELRLGGRGGVSFSRPWAAPTAFTPDGLPLVGALPGRPEVLVAAGFHGRGLAWGVAAGVAIAERIRGGEDTVPERLAPRRLLV
jgi:glycine/D-amino acid oxidase-like deaminating enzyme